MDPSNSWLIKSGVHGALSALGTVYLFGSRTHFMLPVLNRASPLWVLGGVSGAISSLASDYIHAFVKNEIPLKEKAQDEASLVISAGVSAATFLLALYCVDRRMVTDFGMTSAIAVAVGAELGSSFLINML